MNYTTHSNKETQHNEQAIFAGGCFWGVEYYLRQAKGVISTSAGYTGGQKDNPTYKEVCSKRTDHAEAVEVIFDPAETSYENLVKLFLEIHDPTQVNRQGPDIGNQYRSEIFYLDNSQKEIVERVLGTLKEKGYRIATRVTRATTFWKAEEYHQDYYRKTGSAPYCHVHTEHF